MPIYEYECEDCGAAIEILVRSIYFRSPTDCQECQSTNIKKKLANFSVAHSEVDTLRALDPKYKRMVEDEVRRSASYADPMRHIEKMIPFDAVDDPGDPINL
ncbi:MAG: zinc ribbon domain-containing protein [Dehalococcoidia bacterium]